MTINNIYYGVTFIKKGYAYFSYHLILSLHPQSERLRLNLRFLKKMNNYTFQNSVANATYNNSGAHTQRRSMMVRKERLSLNFGVDKDGYYYVMIESKTTTPFKYQLNDIGFKNLFNYLQYGNCDLGNTNPMSRNRTLDKNGDQVRTELMTSLINHTKGEFQIKPAFLDKPDRLTLTARFPYGSILFSIPKTNDMVTFLEGHKLYA